MPVSAHPQPSADRLVEGFRHPPKAAKPRVWWHWMDGNISAEGAKLDLAWMRRIGIGGAHLFEGGLPTPTVVPHRLVYQSKAWCAALRTSVATAAALGLDLAIATSPGWSETGGPQVRPEDAMKKLVWSETIVEGGAATVRLAALPDVAGPYQDVPAAAVDAGAPAGPVMAKDARVLAFRMAASSPEPRSITSAAGRVAAGSLADGSYRTGLDLTPNASGTAWLLLDYGRPVTLRSIRLGLSEPGGFGAPKPSAAYLEASDDSRSFRPVVALLPTGAPARTASFAPVSARWFRLRLTPDPSPGFAEQLTFAPGAVRPAFGPPPVPIFRVSELRLYPEPLVDHAEAKAGFATVPDYYAVATPAAPGIDPADVIDLTNRMGADGTLAWRAPPGRWIIQRLGWSLTGHRNAPAPVEATGLEVDKLDPARVAAYADDYLSRYRSALGGSLAGVTGLTSDSIEAGPQNWTETLPAAFQARRGYDPTPWLPALTGRIVGDAARSDRFLWDWRRTIAELYADAHYGTLARAAHRSGLTYYAEALEDHRPQLGDDVAMRASADVPAGAMWTIDPDGAPKPTFVADLKGAASVANLYAKPFVAAESFTAFGHPFAFAPADLKATADLEFALGVTRVMIHTSAHQPLIDAPPGVALAPFLGQYFTRNETWADMAGAWIDYLTRTSFMLQQGHHVADIALFTGEEAPLTSLYGDRPVPGIPAGHDYDFVDAPALATQLTVQDGALVTPTGTRYRLLLLGGSSERMTLATLRRIGAMLKAGATVVGVRPSGSPSLADDDRQVAGEIERLWGAPGKAAPRQVGQGRLFGSGRVEDALSALSVVPDWGWHGGPATLAVIHRGGVPGDVYFVSNRTGTAVDGSLSLRVAGLAPELWDADTGRTAPLLYTIANGTTTVPLRLDPNGAALVILRRPTALLRRGEPAARTWLVPVEARSWRLRFQPGRGAPGGVVAATLRPWNANPDPRVRYFSGVGTYETTMALSRRSLLGARRLSIDLGSVADVARVTVNGRAAGVAWKAPHRLDVTRLVRPGRNRVRIEVANLWVNRLIGDRQPGAVPVAHVTGPTYAADAPLRPSGLLGPVTLVASDR